MVGDGGVGIGSVDGQCGNEGVGETIPPSFLCSDRTSWCPRPVPTPSPRERDEKKKQGTTMKPKGDTKGRKTANQGSLLSERET